MKNLQKLLLTATFISMIPSARLLCEDEPVNRIETTETIETSLIKNKTNQNPFENLINQDKLLIIAPILAVILGSHGFVGAANGSHSLKTAKRKLYQTKTLTPETLAQLNKGIRNNRIGMAISTTAFFSPFAITKLGIFNKQYKELGEKFYKKTF